MNNVSIKNVKDSDGEETIIAISSIIGLQSNLPVVGPLVLDAAALMDFEFDGYDNKIVGISFNNYNLFNFHVYPYSK